MNTFEKFDWKAYYSLSPRRRAAEAKMRAEAAAMAKEIAPVKVLTKVPPDSPCATCPRAARWNGCGRSANPECSTFCPEFGGWFCEAWKTVTKKLKGEKICE